MRFIVWLLIHGVYRLKKTGLEHIPAQGPALIACNHVSFVDALVLAAACPRPIRFIMDHRIFKIPILNFVFREGRAIPIAPAKEDPAMLERAYEEVAKALADGDLVGIFPEGGITQTGDIMPFRGGVTRILERSPVPVVPMALQGLWDSIFSRKDGPAMAKFGRLDPFKDIGLVVGNPMAPDEATPENLHRVIVDLRGEHK